MYERGTTEFGYLSDSMRKRLAIALRFSEISMSMSLDAGDSRCLRVAYEQGQLALQLLAPGENIDEQLPVTYPKIDELA